MTSSDRNHHLFPALTRPNGSFLMVALDQRESLRAMMGGAQDGNEIPDDAMLVDFKARGVRTLSPAASAVLLDREFGLAQGRPDDLATGCGLIVAADVLHQEFGGPVTSTDLDPLVDADFLRSVGADAIKLLVIWRRSDAPQPRADLVERFLQVARQSHTAALVEGIVRPDGPEWHSLQERHDAVIDAAIELTGYGPDIYKAEVPGYARGDVSLVASESRRMTSSIDAPWVILSNGVHTDDFGPALSETLKGGSSGFLAGRAIWSDVVGVEPLDEAFTAVSKPRLKGLEDLFEL